MCDAWVYVLEIAFHGAAYAPVGYVKTWSEQVEALLTIGYELMKREYTPLEVWNWLQDNASSNEELYIKSMLHNKDTWDEVTCLPSLLSTLYKRMTNMQARISVVKDWKEELDAQIQRR